MQIESPSGQLPHQGDAEKTAVFSSSATVASATTQVRPVAGGVTTRLHHLPRFLPVKIGAGIVRDIRARAPWYWSDWKDAWNYRVVPATALVFFAK
jgi:boron transporter